MPNYKNIIALKVHKAIKIYTLIHNIDILLTLMLCFIKNYDCKFQ